jgi:hypothetical protein
MLETSNLIGDWKERRNNGWLIWFEVENQIYDSWKMRHRKALQLMISIKLSLVRC